MLHRVVTVLRINQAYCKHLLILTATITKLSKLFGHLRSASTRRKSIFGHCLTHATTLSREQLPLMVQKRTLDPFLFAAKLSPRKLGSFARILFTESIALPSKASWFSGWLCISKQIQRTDWTFCMPRASVCRMKDLRIHCSLIARIRHWCLRITS